MKNIKFLILFIGLLFSCDLGLQNGSDLVGKWKSIEGNDYNDFNFQEGDIGDTNVTSTTTYHYYFLWNVYSTSTSIYKRVKISYVDSLITKNIYQVSEYLYYFDTTKNYLYMRNLGDADVPASWRKWEKRQY